MRAYRVNNPDYAAKERAAGAARQAAKERLARDRKEEYDRLLAEERKKRDLPPIRKRDT
jgi:hypothetical protein